MDDERVAGGAGATGETLKRQRRPRASAAVDAERLASGRAWTDFCEALKAAGEGILEPGAPTSDFERAEGFRYLLGLVRSGVGQVIDLADPDVPRFFRNPDSGAKWGAENADNQYLWARIRSDADYRLTGRRGTAFAFLIEVKEGYMQLGEDRNFATLDSEALEVDSEGRFEIVLSAKPYPGNWLPLHPDARYVAIRQYFCDWEHEDPAAFRIVRIGNEGHAAGAPDPASVARSIDDAGEWIETSVRFWNQWVRRLRDEYRPGRIAPARRYVGGADDIHYGNDVFRLAENEALIVETEPPDARYWAFQLCNLWFESLDYANRQTSLNRSQAVLDADGRFRCVIAHRDPGVPNWLDTAGHTEGIVQYRWIWTRTNPQPRARIVPFARLREALPAETPRVTPEERRAAICARQEHVARREPVS